MKLNILYISILIAVSLFFFFPFLGAIPLFEWDEINFAESAREMLVTGEYFKVQINFLPFWEKPPLFIWMQAFCMQFLGIDAYAARLPNAICGTLTLLIIFYIGKKHFDLHFARFWVLAYIGSILPHFYFKSGIIDPFFNLFIFLGIYFGILSNLLLRKQIRHTLLSGFFTGLSVLTKGPVGLLMVLITLCITCFSLRKKMHFSFWRGIAFIFTVLLISSIWFVFEIWNNGLAFFLEFFNYQIRLLTTEDATHGGFIGYHFVVLLIGCFPASIISLNALNVSNQGLSAFQQGVKKVMFILLIVVLVVFTVVKTKIIHYSSLAYFPITFFAALGLWRYQSLLIKRWSKYLFLGIGSMIAGVFIILPVALQHIDYIFTYIPISDPFALDSLKNTRVSWSYSFSIIGFGYLLLIFWTYFRFYSRRRLSVILIFTALLTQGIFYIYLPRIQEYTQGPLIRFYQSKSGEDCYVDALKFKSYGRYFYTQKKPHHIKNKRLNKRVDALLRYEKYAINDLYMRHKHFDRYQMLWHLKGDVDKPTYLIVPSHSATKIRDKFEKRFNIKYLYQEGGYVFLKRNPVPPPAK